MPSLKTCSTVGECLALAVYTVAEEGLIAADEVETLIYR